MGIQINGNGDVISAADGSLTIQGADFTNLESLNVIGVTTFQSNVNIAGTLTYEDVTNVESIGVATFRDNVHIGAGATTAILQVSTGRVGIGTDDPTDLLDVYKDSSVAYDSTDDNAQRNNSASITIRNDNGTTNSFSQLVFDTAGSGQSIARIVAIRTGTATNDLAFVTEHSNTKAERLRISSSGNIGIGTTNPGDLLTLYGTDPSIRLQDSSGDAFSLIEGDNADEGSLRFRADPLGAGANTHIRFDTDGSERLRIDSNGNVGIKTTTPNNTLTVGDTIQTSFAPAIAGNYIEIARTSGGDAGLLINKNTGQWLIGIDNSDGANAPLRFEYGAAGSAHPGLGAGTLGMIINSDGDVNITGVCTATSFSGDGSSLTNLNIPASFNELDSMLFG